MSARRSTIFDEPWRSCRRMHPPKAIQQTVYDIGRRDPYKTVQKDGSTGVSLAWFNTLYQVLLGEEKGPRFGSFAHSTASTIRTR